MNRKMKKAWQRITADRKRFGLFCMLLFVGLLLWARIIVIARPPRTAIADPAPPMAKMIPVSSDNVSIPVVLEALPVRNPFALHNDSFPENSAYADNNATGYVSKGIISERSSVAALKLEAVMGKMATIDGRVYQIGDVVLATNVPDALRLSEVQGRSVIISAGDRRYELTIASPNR